MQSLYSGRYNRAKYVWINLLIVIPFAVLYNILATEFENEIVQLLFSIISFAALSPITVKRLHDLNMSAWYYFLFLIPLINLGLGLTLLFKKGTPGPNKFGEDPLAKARRSTLTRKNKERIVKSIEDQGSEKLKHTSNTSFSLPQIIDALGADFEKDHKNAICWFDEKRFPRPMRGHKKEVKWFWDMSGIAFNRKLWKEAWAGYHYTYELLTKQENWSEIAHCLGKLDIVYKNIGNNQLSRNCLSTIIILEKIIQHKGRSNNV